ncbi:MAG: hypothetical protein J6A07_00480 [Firmicutes bacterium]|nr:hypothetical protein [Bacillota bacterium]
MDFPIPELSVYGLSPRSIIKSKYFYIIVSGSGYYRLYPFVQSEEELRVLFSLNKRLYENGTAVCPVVCTQEGEPFSLYGEDKFILTKVPHGQSPDIENKRDFLKMTELAAKFHKELKLIPVSGECPPLPYEKGLGTLKHIKGIINRKNKLSEIDKLFCENYPRVFACAQRAAEALGSCGLAQTYAYGSLKEENFISSLDGRLTLTNWNTLKVSHFLADLAYMIKRYDKKNPVPQLTHGDIIERYAKINPLTDSELTALYGIMDYPEKYIAVAKEHYSRHRPFAPLYVKEKLVKELGNIKQ